FPTRFPVLPDILGLFTSFFNHILPPIFRISRCSRVFFSKKNKLLKGGSNSVMTVVFAAHACFSLKK
ncbi:MAG: hypothetical protein PUC14_02455, partial [Bacteroidales bacterium]|nr:hypothetical protein [Bacteroidales bacterium]